MVDQLICICGCNTPIPANSIKRKFFSIEHYEEHRRANGRARSAAIRAKVESKLILRGCSRDNCCNFFIPNYTQYRHYVAGRLIYCSNECRVYVCKKIYRDKLNKGMRKRVVNAIISHTPDIRKVKREINRKAPVNYQIRESNQTNKAVGRVWPEKVGDAGKLIPPSASTTNRLQLIREVGQRFNERKLREEFKEMGLI